MADVYYYAVKGDSKMYRLESDLSSEDLFKIAEEAGRAYHYVEEKWEDEEYEITLELFNSESFKLGEFQIIMSYKIEFNVEKLD